MVIKMKCMLLAYINRHLSIIEFNLFYLSQKGLCISFSQSDLRQSVVSSINKTDCHHIIEILLKMLLKHHNLNPNLEKYSVKQGLNSDVGWIVTTMKYVNQKSYLCWWISKAISFCHHIPTWEQPLHTLSWEVF